VGRAYRIAIDAVWRFNDDDGWAIASHIALSALMSLFPFLIVVTALAAFFGSKELADETARLMLEAWPKEVAEPIAGEIRDVLTNLRTDVLTFGVLAAVYFSTSGIDSLRIGLNRAYGVKEPRPWWWLRLESIGYVLVGAGALLAFSFLIVLWPLLWTTAVHLFPALPRLAGTSSHMGIACFVTWSAKSFITAGARENSIAHTTKTTEAFFCGRKSQQRQSRSRITPAS